MTDLTSVKLHGREIVQFDMTGKSDGVPMRFRMILFEHKKNLCNLICWAPEGDWSKAEPAFEEVFAAIE